MRLAYMAALVVLGLAGCSERASQAQGNGTVLLVMGDSLSAGYGLADPATGWVNGLDKKLRQDFFLRPSQVVANASVSGETTAGGLARLPDLLEEKDPGVVVIELGANDALRHQPMGQMEHNLKEMINLSKKSGARVVLVGVRLPGLMNLVGGGKLEETYEKVAADSDVPLAWYPWDDLVDEEGMMQEDRLHPTDKAQKPIMEALEEPIRDALGKDGS